MSKGDNTRSGLLWEIERLLDECCLIGLMPDVLLMENVPQVHGNKFLNDFEMWLQSLERLGYTNFWQDMNAKDYGVAQSRNRTFMISILQQNVNYEFPEPILLDKKMADYLESEVDEKYYINNEKSKKLINDLIKNNEIFTRSTIDLSINEPRSIEVANCIKARYDAGISNFKSDGSGVIETVLLKKQGSELEKPTDIATTLMARDYKGLANHRSNGVIEKWQK